MNEQFTRTALILGEDGVVVANCHKIPANRFTRRCLTVNEIVDIWKPIVQNTSEKHWIFTVSPIRHIKDGLHANQVSKGVLLQAVDELMKISSQQGTSVLASYFPSYEIMLDELRDYRFYAEDMVHPSSLAVDYIWQRFVETYMTVDTQSEMRILRQLWQDRHHRVLHPETQDAITFAKRTETCLQSLKKQYPWLE